jgi:DnaJ-class molecular chaperone
VASHLTETCKTCDGSGRVPRPRRCLPNGEPDRFDTVEWPEVVCDTCAGSGQVSLDPHSIRERVIG